MTPAYRVALLGDAKVGKVSQFHQAKQTAIKTSFIQRHLTGDFISDYTPTTACHITTLPFTTNHGPINLKVLDIPGAEFTSINRAEHLKDVDAAIILFDLSRRETLENVAHWHNEIRSAHATTIPMVICGTKADILEEQRNIAADELIWPTTLKNLEYFTISVRDEDGDLELPFLSILQQIYNDADLHFVPARVCFPHPGQTAISPEELARWTREMEDAEMMSLPSGDESDL